MLGGNGRQLKKISMPPHSFVAFGLFLKIPGYAKCMLKNRKQAQSILKLLLGETGRRNNGEDEFGLSLSIMPFVALKDLLATSKTSVENALVQFLYENNLLTLLLAILSLLSHHSSRQKSPHFESSLIPDMSAPSTGHNVNHATGSATVTNSVNNEQFMLGGGVISTGGNSNEEKNNLYWAKGTGFGTGSTMQQWDAEKTLMQQKMEEEHVTCILEILSIYITCCEEDLSDEIVELIDHSCVINALSSYLRNDSVLDMSRHIPLYRASLRLLQTLILNEKLRTLIQQCNILELIKNIKLFVDSYTQRIR